ncbi:MAG: caspase family protein [Actinobacteria bacterium]|nr:caspase family protein [Actinomycetota bacterium]
MRFPRAGRVLGTAISLLLGTVGLAAVIDLGTGAGPVTQVLGARVAASGDGSATAPSGASGNDVGRAQPPGATANAPEVTSTTGTPKAATGTGVWAITIGVDDYEGDDHDLRAGVADARDMDAALADRGVPASQRRVLLDHDATGGSVREAFDWLAANAGPDATAVLFFSGHVREIAGDEDGDGEEVDEAMILADGDEVFDAEVDALLDRTPARRAWLNIAGCYAGGFDDALAPGRILTGAAPEGVLAFENDKFNRTYLVQYMIRGALLGGHADTVQDAFGWAVEAMRRDYPNRLPVMFDQLGEPLVLGLAPAVVPTRPAPPSIPELGLPGGP